MLKKTEEGDKIMNKKITKVAKTLVPCGFSGGGGPKPASLLSF